MCKTYCLSYSGYLPMMRKAGIAGVVLFVLLAPMLGATTTYNAHPRIWLTSSVLNNLRAKAAGADPDWVKLKATADKYLTYPVAAYDRTATPSNTIYYAYEGLGWLIPIETLGIAYQVTGNVAYANKVIQIVNVMNAA